MTSFVESMESGFEAENSDAVTGPDNLPPLNLFEKEANDVRNHRVPWQSYVKWVFFLHCIYFVKNPTTHKIVCGVWTSKTVLVMMMISILFNIIQWIKATFKLHSTWFMNIFVTLSELTRTICILAAIFSIIIELICPKTSRQSISKTTVNLYASCKNVTLLLTLELDDIITKK